MSLGVLLVLLGAGANLMPTGAYDSVSADRGASIGVSDDPNALLGLDGYSSTDTATTFTNNAGNSMTVTLDTSGDVEFDEGDDASNWQSPPVQFTLTPGERLDVAVRGSPDTAPVDIDVTLTDGGSTVGTIDATRDFAVGNAALIKDIDASVQTSGSSGKYSFELNNTGTVNVTIVGIVVNETTTDAEQVSNGNYLSASGTQVVESVIPVGGTSVSYFGDGENQTLVAGETQSYQFDKFRRTGRGKKNVDMRGQDVKITVYLADGSAATLDLCSDGTDCTI